MTSGGGTTKDTQVQQQVSDPWGPAKPFLTDLLTQAQSTFQGAQGQTAYPTDTVAPFSDMTQSALSGIANRAQTGSPLINSASQSLMGLMQPQTAPGSAALTDLLGGYSDPGSAYTQAGGSAQNGAIPLAARASNANPYANPATMLLGNQASTASINPYLESMFKSASSPVIDAVNAQFAAGGRTGSGANQQELTRNLGDMASTMYGQNYQNAVTNQMNAANSIQGAFDNASGRNLSALGLMGNLSESQANRSLQAGGQLSSDAANQASTRASAANALNGQFNTQNNTALNAAQLAPTLAGQDWQNLLYLLNAGQTQDAQNQNVLDAKTNAWQYGQQQPWNILNNYSGVISGLGALGGSSNGTVNSTRTVPGQSMLPQLLGAGVTAASVFSDARLKTDITRIGTTPNGFGLYRYRFHGSDIPCIGLMAQEVQKTKPEAVIETPSGYLAVNYELALAA